MNSSLVSSSQMRAMEEKAFARGIEAEALMDQAGAGIAGAVQQFFPDPGYCIVYSGKGNNGGDALVAAAHLKRAGWSVDVRLAFSESESGELMRKKLKGLRELESRRGLKAATATIILDGLLGLGAKPTLREPVRSACREINRLRREQGMFVFAVDFPRESMAIPAKPIPIASSPTALFRSLLPRKAWSLIVRRITSAVSRLSRSPIFQRR